MAVERRFIEESKKRLFIKEYLKKESERAGFGGLDIQRTPMGTMLSMLIERPGMVIGRGGKKIDALTKKIANKFEIENPQIEIEEAGSRASLNAQIMAQKVAAALERGWHFRRVGHSTVRRIMGAGAKGCQVIISGKITGQRHRTEKFTKGHVKYCGEVASEVMDEAVAIAKKKLGVLGVKVRIMHPDAHLPDEISIVEEEKIEEKEGIEKKVKGKEKKIEEGKGKELKLSQIPEIGTKMAKKLEKAGMTIEDISEMAIDDLMKIEGIGPKTAKKIKDGMKKLKENESARN